MRGDAPGRGEVWFIELEAAPPARGHEQAFSRPALVISADILNRSRSQLTVILPVTRSDLQNPLHVPLKPPEGGLTADSFVLCDQVRSVSHLRLRRRLGEITPATMHAVERILRVVLEI